MRLLNRFPGGRSTLLLTVLSGLSAPLCPAVDVGSGAPDEATRQRFVNAFYRNNFANLVSLPPIGNVRRLGSTGLVQEFQNSAKTANVKLALIKPNISAPVSNNDVLQVLSDIYDFYSMLGSGTAGYPTGDTLTCPAFAGNSCTYQFFDKNYVLFAYANEGANAGNFSIRDPFYAKWVASGGVNGMGRPIDSERTTTASSGTTATAQIYSNGALYNTTSGPQNGQLYAVTAPIYAVYASRGGPAGFLGLPVSDEQPLPDGRKRQRFQGGSIDFAPGSTPVVQLPVSDLILITPSGGGALQMKVGDTVEVRAAALAANGGELAAVPVTFSTSNSRVVTVQASGNKAVLRAVGSGSASISASSEGKTAVPLAVQVSVSCCQIGEGAPSTASGQAFQDAVTRNRLSVILPAQSPVKRSGTGYIQELLPSPPSPGVRYLVAKSDRLPTALPTAYVVTGGILTRYEQLGGPTGSLGYPISDATPGGRQMFENNAALAGNPVRLVSGAVLVKWAALGYETGAAGAPVGDPAPFSSFSATAGAMQSFRNGSIVGVATGTRSGQGFFVSGPILDRYLALGGANGQLGIPASDEFASGNTRRQNFEAGYIDYSIGDSAAREHDVERAPGVSATPGAVAAGSRVRLSVGGFPAGSTLRVSVTGQPDFLVATQNGSYSWETYVPLSARSGTVAIRAVADGGTQVAEGTYRIRALAETLLQMAKLEGDGQTGPPGSQLPRPLRIVLRDETGNPLIGAPITFQASPGALIEPSSALTDEQGQAAATLRLPLSEGVALASAEAPGKVTTFNARVAPLALTNFPRILQSAEKGSLIAAAAAILQYHQNRGELPSPDGLAGTASVGPILNGSLTIGEQVVNLWRLGAFVGGGIDVTVESPELSSVRDALALGSPVLLALSLANPLPEDRGPVHFVVAIGVAADGGILIHDPNPVLARTNLSQYLAGGSLIGAWRFRLQKPKATGFLVALSQPVSLEAVSPIGSCGRVLELPDEAISRLLYCEGSQPTYQLSIGGALQPLRLFVTDLASGGTRRELPVNTATAYKVIRSAAELILTPQEVSFSNTSVVNAATFMSGISPGSLMTIFGSGLSGPGGQTSVDINGVAAPVLSASPFQINAQVPIELDPGTYPIQIRSPYGAASDTVEIRETAPAIFLLDGRRKGAVVNQDGTVNSAVTPGRRGETLTIYGTGLGAVTPQGSLARARTPVTGVLNGQEIPSSFAGLTPRFIGLYQINLPVPVSTPPGIDLPLSVRQSGSGSNVVFLSIQ